MSGKSLFLSATLFAALFQVALGTPGWLTGPRRAGDAGGRRPGRCDKQHDDRDGRGVAADDAGHVGPLELPFRLGVDSLTTEQCIGWL